ncbi:hypothetical protein BJV82DRAFT_158533 [Fennellomyces sp. T-0311]|nr:hypothetical protein BJV82DRAFT_158533 [Fennellomyces sp. T-0311]
MLNVVVISNTVSQGNKCPYVFQDWLSVSTQLLDNRFSCLRYRWFLEIASHYSNLKCFWTFFPMYVWNGAMYDCIRWSVFPLYFFLIMICAGNGVQTKYRDIKQS